MTRTVDKKLMISIIAIILGIILVAGVAAIPSDAAGKISKNKAKTIALLDAGVKKSAATFTKAKLDTDNGIKVYDLEFLTSKKEYDYEINAKSGKILERKVKKFKINKSGKKAIGKNKAKTIALKDAGVKKSAAIFTKAVLDRDDGVKIYDIKFKTSAKKFEYEIAAKSGAIFSKESKIIKKAAASYTSINQDKAISIALNDAGFKKNQVQILEAKLDYDDGTEVYEVEFVKGNHKYDYELNAKSGKIIEKKVKAIKTPVSGKNAISKSEAKAIALKDAGVNESDVTFTKAVLDIDDGIKVYDIEFRTSGKKYEYEIAAKSGAILSKEEKEIKKPVADSTSISQEKAISIALDDAGFQKSQVQIVKAKLDYDDGIKTYDVEFIKGDYEYEYEINAKSGKIIDKKVEALKAPLPGNNTISKSEAKAIALKDAGVNESAATFTKAVLDYDDGISVYDIEFRTSDKKYEYEISAKSGAILSKEEKKIKEAPANSNNISRDKAISVALNDADFNESQVEMLRAKLDNEDGIEVYEIEFVKGWYEYEYEINAKTGAIISKDVDTMD